MILVEFQGRSRGKALSANFDQRLEESLVPNELCSQSLMISRNTKQTGFAQKRIEPSPKFLPGWPVCFRLGSWMSALFEQENLSHGFGLQLPHSPVCHRSGIIGHTYEILVTQSKTSKYINQKVIFVYKEEHYEQSSPAKVFCLSHTAFCQTTTMPVIHRAHIQCQNYASSFTHSVSENLYNNLTKQILFYCFIIDQETEIQKS